MDAGLPATTYAQLAVTSCFSCRASLALCPELLRELRTGLCNQVRRIEQPSEFGLHLP